MKAGLLSRDSLSLRPCFLFWPGASPPELGTCLYGLRFEGLPQRRAWPREQAVSVTKHTVEQISDLLTSCI